jgi:RHS repeat-associated protein
VVSSVDASAGGTSTINYTYDSRDRLQAENGTVYSWSANGNLVGRTGDGVLEWDFEDRLVKVTKTDGTVVENVYDVDGVLVRTVVNGVGTDLLVDTSGGLSHVVAEVDGSGGVTVLYVRAGDMLLEEIRGGVAKMYEADGLGSVRGLLDVGGTRTDTYAYEAFGSTLSSSGSDANPYRFAGERLVDSVGFYQNRARWLDTRTGRFVSVDPAEGMSDSPLSFHRYIYGNASPVNHLDPTGNQTLVEVGLIVTFSFALSGCVSQNETSSAARGLPPTGEELKKDPLVRAMLNIALVESYNPPGEQGGWIYAHPAVAQLYEFILQENRFRWTNAIYLGEPPDRSAANLFVVGTFHTHPNREKPGRPSKASDFPSGNVEGDVEQQVKYRVPGLVIDYDRIVHVYGPTRRLLDWAGGHGFPE